MSELPPLGPCVDCGRHVRATASTCPFCGAPFTGTPEHRLPPATRISRSALYAFGVGALSIATAAGCTHGEPTMTVYGGPPPDLLGHDGGFVELDAAKPTPPAPGSAAAPAASTHPSTPRGPGN
jgi:hypothetical protein